MQKIKLSHFTCNYKYQYFGHQKNLVLSNSLGTNYSMWDDNIKFLSLHFNILRYDSRGHGASTINQSTASISDLGADVLELLKFLKLEQVYFCGLSIGGLVGQWLAIHYSGSFEKIIISNTAAKIGTLESWNARIKQVSEFGLSSILEPTAARWFTLAYRKQFPQKVEAILDDFENTSIEGYMASCRAVSEADFRTQLKQIKIPVLIIVGTQDEVTTKADGEWIQKQVPLAQLVGLDAAHLSNMEHPAAFANHIIVFTKN
ncbi:3-oxoadipate enol-lactonase [Flavobacterium sp. NKUCC04_CG]|uniref:3-oxoadipate enol-lactonase n=1 Tax=Flavobacterium sp. NKUCC04_CG TaxID=2842121 RepID=UPI001C5B9ABA|nr:3-oxoadipate enol-lactonase [Flavobacterium sp. NKUCC04_CG]MBW3518089.1 3-oxoadipate enol-lactonase [Flavobacterium sp. NKUCC04_CG]